MARRWGFLAFAVSIATAAGALAQPAAQDAAPRAVLVAGDGSLEVFDNAVQRMADWLHHTDGLAPRQILRLSAAPAMIETGQVQSASLAHVVDAIAHLRPAAGEACFVYITSHGVHRRGVYLGYHEEVLNPATLDRALSAGCGDAPTVAIISACYSGDFARPPMARHNRIVLTAARADRPSFGCDADEVYTFYDQCLLDNLGHGPEWRDVYRATAGCVARREREEDERPSWPQGWFGADVAHLAVRGAR